MHHARPDDDHKQPRQNHGQARHYAPQRNHSNGLTQPRFHAQRRLPHWIMGPARRHGGAPYGHRPSARILRPQNQSRHFRRRPADRTRNPLATDDGVEKTPASHPRAQGLAGHHQGRVQEIEKGRLKTFQTTF